MKQQPDIGQVRELFEQALGQPMERRAAWLVEACGSDELLFREVRRLLDHRDAPTKTLPGSASGGGAAAAPALDERIGPYRLVEEIGRGGMGVVYRAEDTRLQRPVALKFLPPALAADSKARERLIAEARAASALDHPNICTIFDIGETEDGALFFVMAYYEGETLAARLTSQGPLAIEEASEIVRQAALGLEHAHAAGVVHRDIKPGNIFLTSRDEVKILDFGLAKQKTASITDSGQVVGTAAYMSPEQVTGRPVDLRSDLWSLGALFYEAVSGRRPFDGTYEAEILYSIAQEEPPDLGAETPEWLRGLIARLLDKDVDRRASSASSVLEALRARTASYSAVPEAREAVRNAPAYLTGFFGRSRELEGLEQLLETSRLVTLSGPGGAGKTRLSVELATRLAPRFRHGACFVPLAALEDPDLVPLEIAKAVGVDGASSDSVLGQLERFLANRRMLLVLDNFEQILTAGPVVGKLLAAAPGLTVVVTSRAPLGVDGERDFPAPPLEAPAGEPSLERLAQASAVQLFVDRAQAVRPSFRLDESNGADVVELCRRLDGLPLAIELAAARTKIFPPKALLERLAERLDLLRSASQGAPARHRTLRQAIAWSYDLLDERARRFFRLTAVFSNGGTFEAAASLWREVAGGEEDEALELLERLGDHNLVRLAIDDYPPRFLLLETIRAFGVDLLRENGEEEDTRVVHGRVYLDLAETAAPKLTTADAGEWLNALDADHDNLRTAIEWAERRGDLETALRFGAALWRFWLTRGYTQEGFERLRRLVWTDADVRLETRIAGLHGFGNLAHYCGRMDDGLEASETQLDLARRSGDTSSIVAALNTLGWVEIERADFGRGRACSEEALEIARRSGDTRGAALALNNLAWIASYIGDYREAKRCHEEGLKLRLLIGDGRGVAFVRASLAWAEESHGDLETASKLVEQARAAFASIGDVVTAGFVELIGARIAFNEGRFQEVADRMQREVDGWTPGAHRTVLIWVKLYLAAALHELGRVERARQLFAEASRMFSEIQFPRGVAEVLLLQGRATASEGDRPVARRALLESIELSLETSAERFLAEGFEAMAGIEIAESRPDVAAEALGAADAVRERLAIAVPVCLRPLRRAAEDDARAALGAAAFDAAYQRGRGRALAEVVARLKSTD